MSQIEPISLPPKSFFGFLSTVPFWGANSRFRKTVKRQLLSRATSREEVEAMWSAAPFPAQVTGEIRECIRRNIGWPNALFLPTDSFLALAPFEIDRYDTFAADTDALNGIYLILHPEENDHIRSDKSIGGLLVRSAVRCGDIPLMNDSCITPEHSFLDVLRIIQKGDPNQ